MLLRMLPEQVSEQWETIRPAIDIAMPHGYVPDEEYMRNVLESLLRGDMHCWVVVDGENDDVKALIVTTFFDDPGGERSLFIFSLYGYKPMAISKWMEAYKTLGKWAERNKCREVVAYTDSDNESVLRIVEGLGGDASRILIQIPVHTNGGE